MNSNDLYTALAAIRSARDPRGHEKAFREKYGEHPGGEVAQATDDFLKALVDGYAALERRVRDLEVGGTR